MILRVAKWHGKSPKPNLDATTVNDRQDKYKRTSIKLNCLDSHDSIKESRNVMQGSDECKNRICTTNTEELSATGNLLARWSERKE